MKKWIPKNQNHEFITELLKILSWFEATDTVWWNTDLEFFVNCNDVFAWGCADAEQITEGNLSEFSRACEDTDEGYNLSIWGPLLFCARMRKMRPQGAYYKHIDKKFHHLFDACGSERKINFANPQNQNGEYLYKNE